MTTRFGKFNFKIPVTAIEVDPNVVLAAKDTRLVLGTGRRKKVKKTDNAYVKVAGYTPRFIKEVMWTETSQSEDRKENQPKVGDKLTVSVFESGDEVKVTGTTKGRGFAGVIKRHGFHGGPKTHGQSDRHRAPGSIGSGTTPGRVWKGKKMAGHMGAAKLTVTGLEVVEVDENNNLIFVKGAVPGPRSGFVILEKTGKVKGYTPPPPPNEEKQAAHEDELRASNERAEKEEKAETEAKEATTENAEELSEATEDRTAATENTVGKSEAANLDKDSTSVLVAKKGNHTDSV